MRYKAIVSGETVVVELELTPNGIEATVGGRPYTLEVSMIQPGVFWLNWGTRSIEVSVLDAGEMYSVSIEGHRIPVEILDSRKMLQRSTHQSERGGASEIRSPMPGKIIRVLTEEGADVKNHQGIVVMEAMKMQNEIKSSMAGRVRKIAVIEGETVRAGDLIAIVDAAE